MSLAPTWSITWSTSRRPPPPCASSWGSSARCSSDWMAPSSAPGSPRTCWSWPSRSLVVGGARGRRGGPRRRGDRCGTRRRTGRSGRRAGPARGARRARRGGRSRAGRPTAAGRRRAGSTPRRTRRGCGTTIISSSDGGPGDRAGRTARTTARARWPTIDPAVMATIIGCMACSIGPSTAAIGSSSLGPARPAPADSALVLAVVAAGGRLAQRGGQLLEQRPVGVEGARWPTAPG